MIRRLFSAAILAGIIAGICISAVHQFTTVPLILMAEQFEVSDGREWHPALNLNRGTSDHQNFFFMTPAHADKKIIEDHVSWQPDTYFERITYTGLTTILVGVGFALLLVSGMVIRGSTENFRSGVIWGIGGFCAFTLSPSMGLPPELPGMSGAELFARQTWWIGTMISTIVGLWALIFMKNPTFWFIGFVVVLAPHIIGAPIAESSAQNAVPAELAAKFVAISIGVSGLFWVLLGGLSGYFFNKFK